MTLIDVYKIPKPLLATMLINLEHIIKEVWVKLCRRKKIFDSFKTVLIIAIINLNIGANRISYLMFLNQKFILVTYLFILLAGLPSWLHKCILVSRVIIF